MMRSVFVRLSGILLLAGWGWTQAHAGELTPQQIYERSAPAVVFVTGHGMSGEKGNGGTGSIISQDGKVLTNAHVVLDERTGRPYERLFVYLKPDRVTGNPKSDLARGMQATLIGYSQPLDLALLRIEAPPAFLPVVELTDSDRVRIGDRVVAIGHPEQGGLWTLTTGVISTEFENFHNTKGKDVFQTETGLNRGNSGGPLLDSTGRVVGINTAIARVAADGMPITSISFSLKSNVARRWLREQGAASLAVAEPSEAPPSKLKPAIPATDKPSVQEGSETAPGPVVTQPKKVPEPSKPGPSKAPAVAQAPPARPYNLDQVVDELAQAEAEMEDMIKDSRREIEMRSKRMGGR